MAPKSRTVLPAGILLVGLLLSACTAGTAADPARAGMAINGASQATTPAAAASAAAATASGSAAVPPAVHGQLLVTLKPPTTMAGLVKKYRFILGTRLMADGRYLVYVDPMTADEAARSALAQDSGIVSVTPNRDFQPATKSGKSGSASQGGWVPPQDTSGIVGDTGTGGDSTDLTTP